MGLLNAPTDNLYKWAAITGLSIMGMCIAIPFSLAKMAIPDAISAYDDLQIAAVEAKHLEILVDETIKDPDLRNKIKHSGEQASSGKDAPPGFPPEVLRQLPLNIRDRILAMEIRLAKMQSRGKIFEIFQGAAQYASFLINAFVGGLFLSMWGFVQWYRRVQSPQDRKLAIEVNLNRKGHGFPISNEARMPTRSWRGIISDLRKHLNNNRLISRLSWRRLEDAWRQSHTRRS